MVSWIEIDALAEARDVAGLTSALADPAVQEQTSMRWAVARALGRTGSRHAVRPLAGLLEDPDDGIRYCAIDGLGNTGDPDAVPLLIGQLRGEDHRGRCWAAEGLGKLGAEVGGEAAVTALVEAAVADPDRTVRSYAATALGALKARSAIPALIDLLPDPSGSLSYSAWVALIAIRDEAGLEAARRHYAEASPLRRLRLRYLLYGEDLELP